MGQKVDDGGVVGERLVDAEQRHVGVGGKGLALAVVPMLDGDQERAVLLPVR